MRFDFCPSTNHTLVTKVTEINRMSATLTITKQTKMITSFKHSLHGSTLPVDIDLHQPLNFPHQIVPFGNGPTV